MKNQTANGNPHSLQMDTTKRVVALSNLGAMPNVTPATPKYRKGSLEAKLDSLLPDWPSFDVIAHELWADGCGYSVNDSWHISRGCDRAEAISHLRNRWEVYKINYEPRAMVSSLHDEGCDEESPCLLTASYPFAEIRNASV